MAAYEMALEIKGNWKCKTSQNTVTAYDATCFTVSESQPLHSPYNPSARSRSTVVGLTIKPPFQCIELAKLLIGLKFALSLVTIGLLLISFYTSPVVTDWYFIINMGKKMLCMCVSGCVSGCVYVSVCHAFLKSYLLPHFWGDTFETFLGDTLGDPSKKYFLTFLI